MNRKLRKVVIIVGAIVAGLLGLVFLQVRLLEDAFALKEQAFRQNADAALGTAALKLQAGETISRVLRYEVSALNQAGTIHRGTNAPDAPAHVQGNTFFYRVASPQRVRIQVINSAGNDSVVVDTFRQPGTYELPIDTARAQSQGYYYRYATDSLTLVFSAGAKANRDIARGSTPAGDRSFILAQVVDDLYAGNKGIVDNLNPALLDSVLKRSVRDAGIPLDFSYGILSPSGDSVLLAGRDSVGIREADFRVPLFQLEFRPPKGLLAVSFHGRNVYLLGQLWPSLGASFLFIGIIGFCFVYMLRTNLRQERLASLMVDFVNNMTHEFKTPIATVTLASEAIQRPDVVKSSSRVQRYNRMIADEMSRMRKQVDRILQMAVIEEGDFDLTCTAVQMHGLIRTAVSNASLQVEGRGGAITCRLGAKHSTVQGDAVHLANIMHNLLDNATKYSSGPPTIEVRTFDDGQFLHIEVSDEGIGIAPEHLAHVFDKYYRVPTGNLHDVKGFGLGLSYVKLLVDAHGGTIRLTSKPGKGTDVDLRLPLSPEAAQRREEA